MSEDYGFPTSGINRFVSNFIRALPDLTGKLVVDIPCGDGRASHEFRKRGAIVKAFDLYPEFIKLKDISAEYADLSDRLPLDDNSVDIIICQEGIEHIPNQLLLLQEFNRVLKKNGTLLITTPNNSHVRARLSMFLLESDYWKRMPVTEIDGVWFSEKESNKLYFGHLFLLGVHHFQTLLSISGFRVKQRIRTKLGTTSLLLGIPLYPFFLLLTLLSFLFYRRKNKHITQQQKDTILRERVKLNLSAKTLFCKHIFWVMEKDKSIDEVILQLKLMSRE